MAPTKPRCLVISCDSLLLEGLFYLLAPHFDLRAAPNEIDAVLSAAVEWLPTTAIIDLDPDGSGSEIGRHLSKVRPGLGITYLTSQPNRSWSTGAVSKNQPVAELLTALHLQPGPLKPPIRPESVVPSQPNGLNPMTALSHRELEVLVLLVRGMTMKEAARVLGITPRTVAFHKYKAMKANHLTSNAELMQFALKHGLLRFGGNQAAPQAGKQSTEN